MYKVFIPIQKSAKGFADRKLLELEGEPLWKRCLRKFSDFELFVDTDCEEILDEIKSSSAFSHVRAYRREEALCSQGITINQLILGFLTRFNIHHEPVIQLHVTTPFLLPRTVLDACERVRVDSNYDSAVSCTPLKKRIWRRESYGFCPINHNPLDLQPSSDLPELFIENSAFFIFEASTFRQTSNRVGFSPWFQPLPYPEHLEVKTEEDWKVVQLQQELDRKNENTESC
jgi:CMP-N-acetylneuraminic acid synthetase